MSKSKLIALSIAWYILSIFITFYVEDISRLNNPHSLNNIFVSVIMATVVLPFVLTRNIFNFGGFLDPGIIVSIVLGPLYSFLILYLLKSLNGKISGSTMVVSLILSCYITFTIFNSSLLALGIKAAPSGYSDWLDYLMPLVKVILLIALPIHFFISLRRQSQI